MTEIDQKQNYQEDTHHHHIPSPIESLLASHNIFVLPWPQEPEKINREEKIQPVAELVTPTEIKVTPEILSGKIISKTIADSDNSLVDNWLLIRNKVYLIITLIFLLYLLSYFSFNWLTEDLIALYSFILKIIIWLISIWYLSNKTKSSFGNMMAAIIISGIVIGLGESIFQLVRWHENWTIFNLLTETIINVGAATIVAIIFGFLLNKPQAFGRSIKL